MRSDTPSRRKRPCDCCRTIRDVLKPLMASAEKDDIVAVVRKGTLDRIYASAKKGARR